MYCFQLEEYEDTIRELNFKLNSVENDAKNNIHQARSLNSRVFLVLNDFLGLTFQYSSNFNNFPSQNAGFDKGGNDQPVVN